MPTPAALAISVGGLFLGQRALGGIAGGLAGLGRALVAWEQVRPIFQGEPDEPATGPFLRRTGAAGAPRRLIDAEGLAFRYPGARGGGHRGRVADDRARRPDPARRAVGRRQVDARRRC